MNRALTDSERQLVRWMLEHGNPEAKDYLTQLDHATVTPWRCECGCASFALAIRGHDEPSGGLKVIADFLFGPDDRPSGIFAYVQEGLLGGVEVYGLGHDAPTTLPSFESLRSMDAAASSRA